MRRRFGENIPEIEPRPDSAARGVDDQERLISWVRKNEIGVDTVIETPFGRREAIYCDYTASARAVRPIEDYITANVLPLYGNTHSSVTVTSEQTTLFVHEARQEIRAMTGAGDGDSVLFVGSGSTAAVELLIHLMQPKNLVVIMSIHEHHSNMLPWRSVAEACYYVGESSDGRIDCDDLEKVLEEVQRTHSQSQTLVALSACSNVTGICMDVSRITAHVSSSGEWYLKDAEYREEGGTPDSVGIIRLALATTSKRPKHLQQRRCAWATNYKKTIHRPGCFSTTTTCPPCSMICSESKVEPVACVLLALEYLNALRESDRLDRTHLRRVGEYSSSEALRPGFTRVSVPYFWSDEQYQLNCESAEWHHHKQRTFHARKWLGHVSFTGNGMLATVPDGRIAIDERYAHLRWFLLPIETMEDWDRRVIVNRKELTKSEEAQLPWKNPPLEMYRREGGKVLVCLSGGKDSLSLLHILHFYQMRCRKNKSTNFELGAITVDPGSTAYNPRPLIEYCRSLNIDYFYEEQGESPITLAPSYSTISTRRLRRDATGVIAAQSGQGFPADSELIRF
ncbi:unnamed protein product [Nippostrongylus brasiliensis]|uniref:Aminotran_5 domain-containing protein n=1 Tax=Nippostrongylus brasiliensis TaxID=27835 RepID=A0A158R1T3_NIPBR|nr:unnamed protein product [Nippostrongylus brasiliensis]